MAQPAPSDIDRSIPVMVRRSEPAPAGPPPQLVRSFMLLTAAGLAAGALLLIGTLSAKPGVSAVALVYGLLAVCAALLSRLPAPWLVRALAGLLAATTLTVGVAAVTLGWGLGSPALSLLPLIVCVMGATGGWRMALLLAAVSAAVVLGVAWAVPSMGALQGPSSTALRLGAQLLAIAVGLAGGIVLARLVTRAVQSTQTREQRFRRLLWLAADAYWEIDGDYKLVAAGQHEHELRVLSEQTGLGGVPWELPRFACDPETLDALLADLGTRTPFRDRPFTWRNRDGSMRSYLASGEPRFDSRGAFQGYWGVARDVSSVQATRAALEATETRYQDLFSHIPTPLVLHRNGRVIDANPAAVTLFGHADLSGMLGTDLLMSYESGESREQARRRIEKLHGQAVGTVLPVADSRLRVRGLQLAVRGTGVRVDVQGGPALLSMYVDVTERLAAEEAVRRSEAMLSHLVDTSPDLITLTEVSTGRYAMVNQAFERVSGWRVAEAVGRTSLELGIWGSAQARQEFVTLLREDGVVTDLPVNFVNRDGGRVPMRVSAALFVMDRRDYMVINARDVSASERERLERDAILNSAPIGIAVTRGQRFVLANPHFESIYGYQPGELIGQPGAVVWPGTQAYEEIGRLLGPQLARGEPVELERAGRRKDGSSFLASVRGRPIDPARPTEGGTAWIVEDVTERRQFEQALARARDDAEAANRAKSAFLANTSHELRTPLNGMIGLARMARASELSEQLRRQYLDQIADSAQSLAGIISDILDLSKIEAGKLQLETTTFDLVELLQALEHTYRTLALARGLALQVEIDIALQGHVVGDPLRLRQILTNFLANAIKFTERGTVRLHASRQGANGVRFEVVDTGPGIEPQSLEQLFKPFTQADQSTTRRFGGTGLGLSICRELALLMGGEVGVDSQLGRGSCFWAELPLPPSEATPAPAVAITEGQLCGTRVLMVEDNPVNMMIAVAMLENWGVEVTQARDGREAVAAVLRSLESGRTYNAVLMDVQMPVMSGHEATRALRRLERGGDVPIIALTAAAMVSERDEALRAGMDEFLTKPIDAAKLHAALLRRRASQDPASTG